MISWPRYTLLLKVCILLLALISFIHYFCAYETEDFHRVYHQVTVGQKAAFMQTAIQTAVDGPFDDRAIQNLCASKNWTEGLIASCGAPQGGVGNVRNVFLSCVRYAIEAGAAFVVPQMIARSEIDVNAITTDNIADFSRLFDREHFVHTLQEGCPQMKVYSHINDLYNMPSTAKPLLLSPQDLSKEFVHGTVLARPSDWRKDFDRWVEYQTTVESRAAPILVQLNSPLLQFPLSYDEPAFVQNFGRIIQFRADTRRLAAAVLLELSQKFSFHLDPNDGIAPNAFMGAHLRTAADATAAGWTNYDTQASLYIKQALEANLSTIYVASGNPGDITRLRQQASPHFLKVTSKTDLLSGMDLQELNALAWDQQALVDYEVLLKSSTFGGISESSFAWNIALRRHLLSKKRDYLEGPGGQTFQDEWSWLYGPRGRMELCAASMWP